MNCHSVQDQLTRAADGATPASDQAAIAAHLSACSECQRFAETLRRLPDWIAEEVASHPVPDAEEMWREVQAQIQTPPKPRKVAPIVWLTAPLAAAAALVFAFLPQRNAPDSSVIADNQIVQVDYVEVEDPDATAMVYVDNESGWLVVWADDPAANRG